MAQSASRLKPAHRALAACLSGLEFSGGKLTPLGGRILPPAPLPALRVLPALRDLPSLTPAYPPPCFAISSTTHWFQIVIVVGSAG